ncbi:transcription factor bHLH68-like isoform X2 [Curcuma longa]|uniref:transcription factor bHLH68-like isoform X2 n=1 Tax=Curcuma longa TaxID=136217 RepID=UPI003D9E924D
MQQMMEGTSGSSAPAWWSLSASMALPQPSNSEMWQQEHDHGVQDLPESWCQLLLGGFIGEEDQKHGLIKRTENDNCGVEPLLHEQMVSSAAVHRAATGFHDQHHQVKSHGSSSWTHNSTVLQASSPRSCVTTSLSTHSMLNFSAKPRHKPADHNNSSEGNSTEIAPTLKKARVRGSSSPQSSLKVRKEKLGDRITALHQLVSPFGKALSLPYLQQQQRQAVRQQQYHHHHQQQQQRKHPGSNDDEKEEEEEEEEEEIKKDLKSRGLCLVPVSFTMHVGGDDGVDFWAPSLAGGF